MDFSDTTVKSLLDHPDDDVCVVTFVSKARVDGTCTNLFSDSRFYYDAANRTIYLSCELSIKSLPYLHLSHILVFISNSNQLDVQYLQWFRRLDAVRLKHKDQLQKKFDRPSGRYCSPRALFLFKPPLDDFPSINSGMEELIYRTLRRSRIVTNNCGNSLFAVPTSRSFVHVGHDTCLEFIEGHTRIAFKDGFNDNVGRNAGIAFFRLPKLHKWAATFEKMVHHFRNVNEIDIDAKFSEVRCSKAYPIAIQVYKAGLPKFYDEYVHQAQMAYAVKVFKARAKGPTVQKMIEELCFECDRYWRDGHESCKQKSLTGFGCVKPIHETGEHEAQVHYLSVCNCGKTHNTRQDPFNLIAANLEFYEMADCCAELEHLEFSSDEKSEADMTCTQTPLVPKFSSWSCVCVGPSSRYSHKSGINDQKGFFVGSNFLLPWDTKIDFPKDILEASGDTRKGTIRAVKVFIGFEYECPDGNRFMMSSPDTILRSSPSGMVKETATKIVTEAMPLYYPCPCPRQAVAQLMRIHVVTPKLAVDVSLSPRVQPSASAPVFYPYESITLTQSAYWILRLPYVYKNQGVLYRPTEGQIDVHSARILGGILTVAPGSLA